MATWDAESRSYELFDVLRHPLSSIQQALGKEAASFAASSSPSPQTALAKWKRDALSELARKLAVNTTGLATKRDLLQLIEPLMLK